MNGPDHYLRAEDLLREVDDRAATLAAEVEHGETTAEAVDAVAPFLALMVQQAQVHAMLARVCAERGPANARWTEVLR